VLFNYLSDYDIFPLPYTTLFRSPFVDLFKLQDRVVQKVIDGLKVEFSGEERARMTKDIPEDAEAYEFYLKGLAYPRNMTGNQKRSEEHTSELQSRENLVCRLLLE